MTSFVSQETRESILPGSSPFIVSILLELVEYVSNEEHQKRLTECYNTSPWLAELTASTPPNYIRLQDSFAKDSTQFLATLRNFIDVYRKDVLYSILKELSERSVAYGGLAGYWALICGRALDQRDARPPRDIWMRDRLFELSTDDSQTAHVRSCAERLACMELRSSPSGTSSIEAQTKGSKRLNEAHLLNAIRSADGSMTEGVFGMIDDIDSVLFGFKMLLLRIVGALFLPGHIPAAEDGEITSAPLEALIKNLRGLVRLIGGDARTHDIHRSYTFEIEENLLQLQNIATSRMPFVASMQLTIKHQQQEIDEQREVIEALMFRHLLENLPGKDYAGMKATEAWREFWEDAMGELGVCDPKDAEESDGDDDEDLQPDLGFEFGEEDGEKGPKGQKKASEAEAAVEDGATEEAAEQMKERALQPIVDSRSKTMAFAFGKMLYGELSTVIHRYKGGVYKVSKTQWGPTIRDILEALRPEDENVGEDGQVDWDEERKRYLSASTSKRKEESEEEESEETESEETGSEEGDGGSRIFRK